MEDNKLIPSVAAHPVSVTNIKENNANTFNIDNSQVTFNLTISQNGISSNAEQMIAIQSFSKQYYQLLVTGEEEVFQNGYVTVPASRALTQYLVPSEIFEKCSSLTESGIAELKTFPAIICRENTKFRGETDPNQWATYGIYFDLNMDCAITDLNRSAWSVHKVNLFTAFDEAGITGLPRPD